MKQIVDSSNHHEQNKGFRSAMVWIDNTTKDRDVQHNAVTKH
jgi:hypothetical protein